MVGIGGGSSIDSAKAIALLALAPEDAKMRDFKVPNAPPAGLPIIAIPTTAGTGSEVTRVTIITDDETNEKMLCMGFSLMPRAALVDYTLTFRCRTGSPPIAASTPSAMRWRPMSLENVTPSRMSTRSLR